jgi:hypothetical protein
MSTKSLSTDTLAYQLGVRPALQFRDMSKAPLSKVMAQINVFTELDNAYTWIGGSAVIGPPTLTEPPKGDPQKDAAVFYLLNHAVSCTRKTFNPLEPLPVHTLKLLDAYHEQMVLRGTRMFYYLLLICVRESRHHHGISESAEKKLRAKYTDSVVDFMDKVGHMSESQAVDSLRSKPPDVPVGLWVEFMSEHFRKYQYSHAFGGEKWGQIADVVREYVHGRTTLEMLLDASFTLSHNTSPAFDKGMLYDHYNSDLLKILDVQNSGQIPQLIYEGGLKCANELDLKALLQICREGVAPTDLFGTPAQMYVDWYKVESDFAAVSDDKKAGHDAKYPNEKAKQAKLYGIPGTSKGKSYVQSMKEKIGEQAKEAEALSLVSIFPGQFIKKIARKDL